jgi:uncharacterized protein YhfF
MPSRDDHAIGPFWEEFQAAVGADASPRFYEAFHFDDNERSADELAELVLAGTKRATAGLLWVIEAANQPPPKPGDLSVVTNWQGKPLCVIETTAVTIVPFEEVTADFAATEGEGDKTLRHWREVHWAYFGRECGRIGKAPDLRMPVVCEQFAVIYPRAGYGQREARP